MIAVTGAAGFHGRRVVAALTERGEQVRAVLRRESQAKVVDTIAAEIAYAEVRDEPALRVAFEGADRLIHLAAILRERGAETFESVNIAGTANVFRAAAAANIRRALYVSVVGADENSPEPYLASRGAGERIAIASGIPTSVIRFSALFGEGDEFLNVLAAFVRLGPIVPVAGGGEARFQPLDARDAAEAIVHTLHAEAPAEGPLEAGGPEIVTYNQIIDTVAGAMGRRTLKVHVPIAVLAPIVQLMNLAIRTPPVTPNQLRMLRLDNVAGPNDFEARFGFTPRSMRGNIDYVRSVGLGDALRIVLGKMPRHIRDH